MRKYEEGDKFSNILGYIRQISDEELKEYEQYGYDSGDIVGKTGIEKVMELELNGKDGKMLVEAQQYGTKNKHFGNGSSRFRKRRIPHYR